VLGAVGCSVSLTGWTLSLQDSFVVYKVGRF
jgi:hypothetical protein